MRGREWCHNVSMISVSHHPSAIAGADSTSIEHWLDTLAADFSAGEIATIRSACELAAPLYDGQTEITGAPLLQHALGAASILAAMRMDAETIAATVLHAVPAYLDDWEETLATCFGTTTKGLVEGISRMEQIQQFSEMRAAPDDKRKNEHGRQLESLRKMLLAMVEDIRVVLIKLAERTQTLRNLSAASAEQQLRIAHETQSIFAPLANRLGVWQLKWELEDLSLRYLEPALYKQVARLLDERRVDREQYIADVIAQLKRALEQAGIRAEVTGRPKHIYSIINKMKRKQIEFGELYDVRAVRILVGGAPRQDEAPGPKTPRGHAPEADDIKDCYAALSVVHELWQPIASEFDDYIAHPKNNNYRSLHTAVNGPRGLPLEVQIRTQQMHHDSELGVAAHWRYKEGGKSDAGFDEKISWLRQILAWKEEVADRSEMAEQFRSQLFHEQVYVLTPQGKVVALPQGATPVDFAYALHTGLGHRTRGAKVDGSIVPLNYRLQNGQRVELLTTKQGAPSRDWLNPNLGYLQSPSARAKVRHWFKQQDMEEHIAQGRSQLDRELHRLGVASINQEKIAHKLHFARLEDFLAAIGRGEVSARQIGGALQEEQPKAEAAQPIALKPATAPAVPQGITVEGVGNLMTRMAKCCKPLPPDAIVGYVTRDKGITIHRRDCPSIQRLLHGRGERIFDAQWGSGKNSSFTVEIEVTAHDRPGLLRDIGDLFLREKVNVTKVDSLSRNLEAKMRFSVSVADAEQIARLTALIRQIPNVVAARRYP
jgi:GTP pyrophosphokinase